MVDEKKLSEFADRYLQYVRSTGLDVHAGPEEGYKFKFVNTFQHNFDLDAPDLAGMLEKAIENCNLVATGAGYLPRPVLLHLSKENPHEVRDALQRLFTEGDNVQTRIDEFVGTCDSLVQKRNAANGRKDISYIGLRFTSLLLATRFPEKYYAVKPAEWRRFAAFIDAKFEIPAGASEGEKYLILAKYGDALNVVLLSLPEAAKIRDAMTAGLEFKDPHFNWITQDAIFVTAKVIDELLRATSGDEVSCPKPSAAKTRTWAYAPGENARHWEEFYREGILAIGWDEMGDLRQYPDLDTTAKKLIEIYHLEGYPINNAHACYDFAHLMAPGDRVFVKRGVMNVIGYGIVTGDYEYRPERREYHHVRTVKWERKGDWPCPKQVFPAKTLTEFTGYPRVIADLEELINVAEPPQPPAITAPPYDLAQALESVAFDPAAFARILRDWRSEQNLILQGPPGVGKTFLARRLAYSLIKHELPSRVEMIQFHQGYAYEDFIQGYKPAKGGFECRDGVFVRFCKRASLDGEDSPYVFIIDEINRGNLSKIFGEAMVLIERDKRGHKHSIALAYSNDKEEFYVPPNVFVLGMMNTADRSLALVDYALRRRFLFESLDPLFGTAVFDTFLVDRGTDQHLVKEIVSRCVALNEEIANDPNLGRGFQIGHSYFCPADGSLTEEHYFRTVEGKIVPLLREYWFDNPEKVQHWHEKLKARFKTTAAA